MLALLCISISIFTYIPQAIRFFAFLYNFLDQAYNTTELTFCIAYFSRSPHPALPFMEMRLQLLFMAGIIALQIAAEKCRQLVGEESSSKSRTERFTFLNCFDMSYGTIACVLKEIVKLYFYYIRAAHVDKVAREATEAAMREKLSEGGSLEEAIKWAYQEGNAAKKRATRQAKHIMGPLISSAWDFFETIWVGGTLAEGAIRGTGTFFGSYAGGIIGEGRLGWVGFLVGSQMGSWIGGRIGLMAYDVGKGVQYLLQFVRKESNYYLDSKDPSL